MAMNFFNGILMAFSCLPDQKNVTSHKNAMNFLKRSENAMNKP